MLKAFKYRLYPTKKQEALLLKHFDAVRFIYNWGLQRKSKSYQESGENLSRFDLQAELPGMKLGEFSWLKDVGSTALQVALENLDRAFRRFFKEKAAYPKFKRGGYSKDSFCAVIGSRVDFKMGKLHILKFPEGIKCVFDREFEGKIKRTFVSKVASGKYFASVLIEDGERFPQKKKPQKEEAVAFDMGVRYFLTDSSGTKIENMKFLKGAIVKLKKMQRAFSRKKKGSKNELKMKLKLAKYHEKIANRRTDFLHKVSSHYAKNSKYSSFCFEDLNIKGLLKNHSLAQSIQDASWNIFIQYVSYKAERLGKNVVKIGRFEPSSKMCLKCGNINFELKLRDRNFVCNRCGFKIDRDFQASKNILNFAFANQKIPTGCRELKPVENDRILSSMKQEGSCSQPITTVRSNTL